MVAVAGRDFTSLYTGCMLMFTGNPFRGKSASRSSKEKIIAVRIILDLVLSFLIRGTRANPMIMVAARRARIINRPGVRKPEKPGKR